MILSELKDISVIDWGNTSLTKKSYQDLGKFLGVSAAGCDGRMDHAEHEVGTLVLSAIGAKCGKLFYPNESFTAIKNTITIKPNDSVDSKYLFYYLNNNQIQSRGAGQPFITKGAASKTKIPLPPLDQQKKIAAILDAADAYRQKTKALIEKYDELTQSLFLDMFGDPETNPKGWEENTLGGVIELITYGLTVRPEYHSEGVSLISAREIRTGVINLSSAPKISMEDFQELSEKGKPKKGDILFSKTGSIGHCAIVEDEIPFAVTQNAARIVFKYTINRVFAINYLRTPFIQTLSQRRAKGNAVKDLQLGEMKKFKFLIPSLEIQNQFAERVQAIEAQKARALASLAQAEDLFNSLLQRAFKGELV